ncbi:MAG: endonuclease/exonuclease/phosphatase family protein [Saprospiraceae bacterium]|jgi:endonuclease/exonuclease/phosphatase family metal-dependent hydrolase|nr:endonuclease/exonuclease/phosphatase family protein [Saprospiraceae bacterium]
MRQYFFVLILLCSIYPPVSSSSSPVRENLHKWQQLVPCYPSGSPGKISVLTYNTWGLPVNLPGHQQETRFPQIPLAISSLNASIVCLQETFHPKLRMEISNKLLDTYPYHTELDCQRDVYGLVNMDCYGGLLTLSKYPIISERFYPYPLNANYSLIEKTGQKGFILTSICIGEHMIHVVNTHLYAGYSQQAEDQRALQFEYMTEVLEDLNLLQEPVLLAGDMNIQHSSISKSPLYEYLTMGQSWEDVQPKINSSHFTSDHVTNDFVSDNEPRAKLDYIFYRPALTTEMELLTSYKCLDNQPLLSDHFGWMAFFQVRSSNYQDSRPLALLQPTDAVRATTLNK